MLPSHPMHRPSAAHRSRSLALDRSHSHPTDCNATIARCPAVHPSAPRGARPPGGSIPSMSDESDSQHLAHQCSGSQAIGIADSRESRGAPPISYGGPEDACALRNAQKVLAQFDQAGFGRTPPSDDDQVQAVNKLQLHFADNLPKSSTDEVARHGSTDALGGNQAKLEAWHFGQA